MIILFISAILTSICYQIYTLNFQIQGINRAIVTAPIEVMFSSISIDEDEVWFIKNDLENTLNTYYSKILPRYCKSFTTDYYYYNPSNGSMCISNHCYAFEVTIDCKLNAAYTLERIMYYQIRDNYNG